MSRKLRTLTLSLATVSAALCLVACSSAAATPVGVWGDETTADAPNLTLAEDGTVSGSDGCNRIVGSYTHEGDTVTFAQLATTMRFCEGIDTWLSTGTSATVSGDSLLIFNDAGDEIGALERSK